MGRLRYYDIKGVVHAARGAHGYCARLAARMSMTVKEAKDIPGDLRAEIGISGDKWGFEPVRLWVVAEGAGVVNPLIVAELRDGPVTPLSALNNARIAARTLANYIHDNVSTLAEEHTDRSTDIKVVQTLPQVHLDEIKTLAAAVLPSLADFLE